MLTLITGLPGAGKTLNALQIVEKEKGDRPVFYRGIKQLTLDWTEIQDEEVHNWNTYPEGTIFVIDEAQQIWPNIAHSKQSPKSVMQLDTHRHRGYDFYVITQQPTLIDFRLRKFVNRHLHFERAFGRHATRQLEWQQVENDPRDYHARQEAEISRVRFKKTFYDKYHSAEVHTHKPRIPKKAIWFLAAILFTGGAFTYAYNNIVDRAPVFDRTPIEVETDTQDWSRLMPGGNDIKLPETTSEYVDRFTPRIPDLPWSAPAYDELTEVKTYPRPQCILHVRTDNCSCFTQQASPLTISQTQCKFYVKNGYFNPFKEEREGWAEGQALAPPAPPPAGNASQQPQIATRPLEPVARSTRAFGNNLDLSSIRHY